MTKTATKAPTVRIVWMRDMTFDVYHDAILAEHIWMDNEGRWWYAPAGGGEQKRLADSTIKRRIAQDADAKWAAGQADLFDGGAP